jgi:homogentisate 1,2-dioxygenase
LFSTQGFSNDYSVLYHYHPPTVIIGMDTPYYLTPRLATERMLRHRSLDRFRLRPETDFLQSRRPVRVNDDCQVVLVCAKIGMKLRRVDVETGIL